ncbi:MAG: chemotaxis protein CheC [Gemmatimonadales bacterium]|nr:chemotaxis protein CheC [Gemmatimonadales bacterium]
MDGLRTLSPLELDALREVANIGAGHAATALSQMTGRTVMIDVPAVKFRGADQLGDVVGDAGQVVAGVVMHVMGDLTGRALVLFPEAAVPPLGLQLLGRPIPDLRVLGAMEQSALKEVGNILVSAYLTALSEFLHLMLAPSVPGLVVDAAGSVLAQLPAAGGAPQAALCVETTFRVPGEPDGVHGHFVLLPDLASLQVLLETIRPAR